MRTLLIGPLYKNVFLVLVLCFYFCICNMSCSWLVMVWRESRLLLTLSRPDIAYLYMFDHVGTYIQVYRRSYDDDEDAENDNDDDDDYYYHYCL